MGEDKGVRTAAANEKKEKCGIVWFVVGRRDVVDNDGVSPIYKNDVD